MSDPAWPGATYLSDGIEVPTFAVEALKTLDDRWPGATLQQARPAIVREILAALRAEGYELVKLPAEECVEERD